METKKIIVYSGNSIYTDSKGTFLNFGLYGYDDIDFTETKDYIKAQFIKKYKAEIEKALKLLGLKYIDMEYYSPKEYNFSNDSLDLKLSIVNKSKLKNMIIANKDIIQKNLNKNKSYDGYMSLTINSAEQEIEDLETKKDYELDIIVLATLLNKIINFDFDIQDYFIYEQEAESEV
jgi:hypothetical protein